MLGDSVGLPARAVEFPLARRSNDADIHTINVAEAGFGESIYDFRLATVAGSTRAAQAHGPIALSCVQDDSREFIWRLESAEPCVLALHDVCLVAGGNHDNEVRLEFPIPLLPSICGVATAEGHRVFSIAADGSLVVVSLAHEPTAQEIRPLHHRLSAEGSVTTVSLAETFERVGTPTTLLLAAETLCIGTASGTILCLPAMDPNPATAMELTASSGLFSSLTGALGGLLGKPKAQPVEQLAELHCMGRPFLCSIHAGSVVRVWDLESRRMLHSAELLPPQEGAAYKATLARSTVEPLDASTSILLVFFEPLDSASPAPGHLCTFEVFIEDRGSAVHIHMEGGPRLAGTVHRLRDLAIQHMGVRLIATWLLYDDAEGWRHVDCVPVAFADGAVQSALEVKLVEDQILSTCPLDPTKLQILEGLRTTLQDAAAATNVNINVAQCLLDEVFAPGLMSRAVLLDALAEVGALTEDMRALTTVEEFSAAITAWVDSVAGDHQAGAMGAWAAVLHAYARAFRRRHLPIGLLQETAHREEQALMLVCSHGAVSTVRMAQAVELAAANLWPKQWDRVHTAVADGAGAVLHASSAMVDACGGKAMLSMLRACYLHGMPLSEAIAAALRFLTSGDVAAGADDAVAREWRAQCRTLPLVLSDHLAGASEGLAYAVDSLLGLLSQQLIPLVGNRKRSPLTSVSRPLAMAALAHGHQAASSQLDCLLGAMMLVSGVLSGQPGTAQWRAGDRDIRHLAGPVSERLGAMLAAAGVAYWSVTTLGPSATSDPAASSDPSSLVVSLRLGGGAERMNSPASGPNKRARLTPWQHTSYVAEHLFPAFKSSGHAVRDVLDVQSVASAFARWMLCVPGVRALDPAAPALPASIATARALDLAAALLQARAHASLKQLLAAVPHGVGDDPCLQFFAACATALAISEAAPGERRRLEEDSVATFFKVATLFPNRTFFGEQLKTVSAALRHLGIEPAGGGPSEMDEAQYYETLMGLYSRLGCAWGASRFALAAVKHVASPSEDQEMDDETVQRTSRLWSAVFAFCLEAGEYDEAYAALLGNDVAEQQVECVHRLVKDLCDRGDIATLCALPFANNGIEVHKGRWVSLLDEAVLALRRRAEAADLDAVPQPYKVLFDFHVARGNYQSAATAMLTYARRLTAERTSEPTASDEAHRALGAAVGALGLVRPEQAWVEDPILEDLQQPRVLTLRDLRKEHAVARARAAVSTVGAGTTLTSSSAPEDILDQLLTLGLHDEAFALIDAVFVGTKLQRSQERAIYSLASQCAQLQLRSGGSDATLSWGGDAYMLTEDGTEDMDTSQQEDPGAPKPQLDTATTADTAASPSAVDVAWGRLRARLEGYERGDAHGYRLRLVAIEAVLKLDLALSPPRWLLAPFVPPPVEGLLASLTAAPQLSADVAALVRLYMRYDRMEDAAVLAVRFISVVADSVPSMVLSRPASVCLPHALFDELAAQLPQTLALRQKLVDKLAAARTAATSQTGILEKNYA